MVGLRVNGQKFEVVELQVEGSRRTVRVDGSRVQLELERELSRSPLELLVRADRRVCRVMVEEDDGAGVFPVRLNGKPLRASLVLFEESLFARVLERAEERPAVVTAPMAGRIVSLRVVPGSVVEEGQGLFVLEAMKMENEVGAPRKGVVRDVYVTAGALVKAGDKLALVE